MNKRVLALLAVAAIIGMLMIFDSGEPAGGVVEAVERSAPAKVVAPVAVAAKPGTAEPEIARLIPRAELIGDDEDAFKGGNAVFGSTNWNPPPPPPPPVSKEPPPPPPPPTAPPLPFTYLGKAVEAGTWEVYLARADKTFIVKNQTVIDGVYRVDAIAPPTLTFTYLPMNQVQTLNIGVLE